MSRDYRRGAASFQPACYGFPVSSPQQTTKRSSSSQDSSRPVPKQWGIAWVFPISDRTDALTGAVVSIGRGNDCGIQLVDEGISRLHAEVVRQGPLWIIRDCGSTNGTFLEGVPVSHEALHPGAVIRIGSHVGIVRSTASTLASNWIEVQSGFWLGQSAHAELSAAFSVAATDLPIAIHGETGTGKERVARAIHALSARGGAFVGLNCAAISEQLAESELFGHLKGAFTGAVSANEGHIRAADCGTLFLDEVAELPLGMQAKLLRVLQEGEVTPVGATRPIPVNLRVVSASQRNLAEYVQEGTFREDLMMRLNGLTARIPPLRDRREDIFRLFEEFTRRASKNRVPNPCTAAFVEALCLSGWPGNVRQLEVLARRLAAIHGGRRLQRSDFPEDYQTSPEAQRRAILAPSDLPPASASNRKRHDLERLGVAMKQCGGNLTEAAKRIGLSRMRAYRLIHELRPDILEEARPSRGSRSPKMRSTRQVP